MKYNSFVQVKRFHISGEMGNGKWELDWIVWDWVRGKNGLYVRRPFIKYAWAIDLYCIRRL